MPALHCQSLFPCDCFVDHIAFLPLVASVQGCSVWDQRHFNSVINRAFIKRQLHGFGMRPKGRGKHDDVGYMGKGKAKGRSRVDSNLRNTESRGETTIPEQDPVKIESESEASPISEAETIIMPTPGHARCCVMQASTSFVHCGSLLATFHSLLSTFAVNLDSQISHCVMLVLDTPVDSDRPCSHFNGIMLQCH